MDQDNPFEQIDETIQNWNRDEAPFLAVKSVMDRLTESNQKFSSITAEMNSKNAEVDTLCESTRNARKENTQQFQQWYDPTTEDNKHFIAELKDIEKRELPPDDNLPKEIYGGFDNSKASENDVDKDEVSEWLEQQRRKFFSPKH